MITLPTPIVAPTLFGSFGTSPGLLQPTIESSRTAAGLQITLEWAGDYATLASFQAGASCTPGAIALPQSLALVDANVKIKLVDSTLRLEEGGAGTLRNTYAERTVRETDADMALGLISRTASCQWIERQEQIEHFAARLEDNSLGQFNPTLLELWRNEEAADLKANFKVRLYVDDAAGNRTYLKTVDLDNSDTTIDAKLKGSALTKAVAQRVAQGVEYASRYIIQVVAKEVWRVPPTISSACNTILTGLPAAHVPLFGLNPAIAGTVTWMLVMDYCEQADAGSYHRTTVYMGMPTAMMPNPVPESWGTAPYDALLYATEATP